MPNAYPDYGTAMAHPKMAKIAADPACLATCAAGTIASKAQREKARLECAVEPLLEVNELGCTAAKDKAKATYALASEQYQAALAAPPAGQANLTAVLTGLEDDAVEKQEGDIRASVDAAVAALDSEDAHMVQKRLKAEIVKHMSAVTQVLRLLFLCLRALFCYLMAGLCGGCMGEQGERIM